ncbi:MAG: beta-galactosidase [Hadesarchaea archaeon]|nr:beta-galactosidase [Hadesarchaea archaeon]
MDAAKLTNSKKIIGHNSKSMIIKGKRVMLFGGELHYFRIPHELWEDRLVKMKRAGCNFVSTYVPWNWHEPREGQYRWTDDCDLGYFLKLCKKHGLYVVIKPGPYICAEWDFGGFPDWLLSRKKKLKLRLLDDEYLSLVEKWFKAISSVIKPYLITNGGNIILFQIENEYDHLIKFGDVPISKEYALKYISRLVDIARDVGIDVPLFTNEGEFLRSTEIIDARTFYPDIPWLWSQEFNHFEERIEKSKIEQPDKPILILELESGWFDQFGQPKCEIPINVLETCMRSVLAQGASLLNVYMFAGGTTWPYWGCRGDIYDLFPPGYGIPPSYDFGISPIREWGELSEKYYTCHKISMFLENFQDLITETEIQNENTISIKSREAKKTRLLKRKKAEVRDNPADTFEKIRTIYRAAPHGGLLFVRNLEKSDRHVSITLTPPFERKKLKIPVKGELQVLPYSAVLLPVDVKIPSTNLTIEYSTSELLAAKKIGNFDYLLLYGKRNQKGETVLRNVRAQAEIIEGEVKQSLENDVLQIQYIHDGIKIVKLDSLIIIFLDDHYAGRTWIDKDLLMISDFYFVEKIEKSDGEHKIHIQTKPDVNTQSHIFLPKEPKNIKLEKKSIKFDFEKKINRCKFEYKETGNSPIKLKWLSPWKYALDDEELQLNYDDNQWKVLDKPISLEQAEILEHGYIWYRARFTVPDELKNVKINVNTGGIDRAYFYLNGNLFWRGIGGSSVNVDPLIRKGENILAVRYYNSFHPKAHPHEGIIQKYSGLQFPIQIEGVVNGKKWTEQIEKSKVRAGLGGDLKGFHALGYDDSDWVEIPSGEKYVCADETKDIVWFRRKFSYEKEKSWGGAVKLLIPAASERFLISINGKFIGVYESTGPQFEFYVPESVLKKENVLVLLLEGPGFHKIFQGVPKQPYLEEPIWGTYYKAKRVELEIVL